MRTYVITGGTDGIGAALARALLARGDHAVVIGTNRGKAERIAAGEAGQITFVPPTCPSYRTPGGPSMS
ncbi:SDR family NAD(P)-dependent oxidoreductase [Phytohabitans houttuyneae]|uniref:Ketoreductase (KR) domain-containing protein n=1 Tax=Phytohabitans houttuyneae TaxID=1076126 RepID=A0A6V8KK73_9ACTN|nr:SDR family NAD(P)-dependent oxidoreductase [Phytohabitans houttuyneae]GFJ83820.1 hypothetical protein Phou_080000 [Phytohabitans houttuyneae]